MSRTPSRVLPPEIGNPTCLALALALALALLPVSLLAAEVEPVEEVRELATGWNCGPQSRFLAPLAGDRLASVGLFGPDGPHDEQSPEPVDPETLSTRLQVWDPDLEVVRQAELVPEDVVHRMHLAGGPQTGLWAIWPVRSGLFQYNGQFLAQRLDAGGAPVGELVEVTLDAPVGRPEDRVQLLDVAVTPDGGMAALTLDGREIVLHRIAADGAASAPFVVIQDYLRQGADETYGLGGSVLVAEEGLLVAWIRRREDLLNDPQNRQTTVLSRFVPFQGPAGPEHPVAEALEPFASGLELVPDHRDGALAVWNDGSSVRVRRLDSSAAPVAEPFTLPARDSVVAVDQVGRLAVAWTSSAGVFFQLRTLGGEELGPPLFVGGNYQDESLPYQSDFPKYPHVLARGAGRFDVFWRRSFQVGTLPTGCELRAETYVRRLAAGCEEGETGLCLQDGRFRVSVQWEDQHNLQSGTARSLPLTADTGGFWFFREGNVELVTKILDGRPVNGYFWLFYASLSDVGYRVTVADSQEPRSRDFVNPPGTMASFGTTTLFPDPAFGGAAFGSADSGTGVASGEGTAALESDLRAFAWTPGQGHLSSSVACGDDPTVACLQDGRFAVEVTWSDPFNGGTGRGVAVPVVDSADPDSVAFWFFDDANLELVVKVLDGREVNGHFWVFYGSLTNVGFRLTVTDLQSGAERSYDNPPYQFASRGATDAFAAP